MSGNQGRVVVGVDGCPGGWVAVSLSENSTGIADVQVYSSANELWAAHHDAALILIDIPIGLPDDHERTVDAQARAVLKARRNSVFPVPTRDAVYAATYAEANEINARLTGKKLSKQTWGIVPKIREVDLLLSNTAIAREKFVEIHPEVLFWGFTGRPMVHAKNARVGTRLLGINERLAVLEQLYPDARTIYQKGITKYRRSVMSRDDVVDALAAAVTGWLWLNGEPLSQVVENPEFDAHGLPMRMVYVKAQAVHVPVRATQTQMVPIVANLGAQHAAPTHPHIARLHHAQITIPKGTEDAARKFYCELLGLQEIPKPDSLAGRGGFWVKLADQQIHVGTEDGFDRLSTKAHLAYQVVDLAAWRERLTAYGIVIEEQIPIPGLDRFEFRDPFGNRVEFTEPQS